MLFDAFSKLNFFKFEFEFYIEIIIHADSEFAFMQLSILFFDKHMAQ